MGILPRLGRSAKIARRIRRGCHLIGYVEVLLLKNQHAVFVVNGVFSEAFQDALPQQQGGFG